MSIGVRPLLIACCVLACIPKLVSGVTPADESLLRQVATLYRANLDAVKTAEYDYTFEFGGTLRACRYARDGAKFRHASLDRYTSGDGLGMPHVAAWDGQRGYMRARANVLTYASQRDDAFPSCQTIEQKANLYLRQALGFEPKPDEQYRLRSARRVEVDGHPCIELTFDVLWNGGTLVAAHATDAGYWPVSVELIKADGRVSNRRMGFEFRAVESGGNTLYFPTRLESRNLPDDPRGGVSYFRVDPKSIRLNEPIDPATFVLTPWPSEETVDLQTLQTTKPVDYDWKPAGKVGFPFDEFLLSVADLERRRRADEEPALAALATPQPGAAGQTADGASNPPTPTPAAVLADSAGGPGATWLVAGGVGLLVGLGAWTAARRWRSA